MEHDNHLTMAKLYRKAIYDDVISRVESLMDDEELLHLFWGIVVYSSDCILMDKLSELANQITVITHNGQQVTNTSDILRKGNSGIFNIKLY